MECNYASELFSLCIDEMLDETRAQALRLHLETCAVCRREYEQLARMTEALRSVPETPLPEAFDARLKKAVALLAEETPTPSSRSARETRRRSRRVLSSVAAVFAIGLLSLFVYNNLGEKRVDPAPLADAGSERNVASEAADGELSPKDETETGASDMRLEVAADTDTATGAAESARGDDVVAAEVADIPAEIAADSAGPYAETSADGLLPMYGRYEMPGYPARGTTTGAHRLNEKAIHDEMLKEKLDGWTYEITGEEERDDAFVYRVYLISNSAGMIFNQEIEVVAAGNVLEIHYATEFMGL
jgi:hypothetical protein